MVALKPVLNHRLSPVVLVVARTRPSKGCPQRQISHYSANARENCQMPGSRQRLLLLRLRSRSAKMPSLETVNQDRKAFAFPPRFRVQLLEWLDASVSVTTV